MAPRILNHTRLLLALVALPALLLFAVACGGDDDDDDGDVTPSATATTPTAVSEKTATPTTPATPTKAANRTGDAKLDAAIDALVSGDAGKMVAKLEYVSIACVTEIQGAGSPPKCETGETAGTKVKVFPASQCEGFYSREANVEQLFKRMVVDSGAKLYAVYRARPEAYGTAEFPRGEYGVVLALAAQGSEPAMAVTAGLDSDGNIVTLYSGCGASATQALETARPAEVLVQVK